MIISKGYIKHLRYLSQLYEFALCFGRKSKFAGTGPNSISLKHKITISIADTTMLQIENY